MRDCRLAIHVLFFPVCRYIALVVGAARRRGFVVREWTGSAGDWKNAARLAKQSWSRSECAAMNKERMTGTVADGARKCRSRFLNFLAEGEHKTMPHPNTAENWVKSVGPGTERERNSQSPSPSEVERESWAAKSRQTGRSTLPAAASSPSARGQSISALSAVLT